MTSAECLQRAAPLERFFTASAMKKRALTHARAERPLLNAAKSASHRRLGP